MARVLGLRLMAALGAVFVIIIVAVSVARGETLDAATVRLVDWDAETKGMLFRGCMPKTSSGAFAYDDLAAYMEAAVSLRVPNGTVKFPSDYYLVDVTLLNSGWATEQADYKMEVAFFADNPSLGMLEHNSLNGVHSGAVKSQCGPACCYTSNCGLPCLSPSDRKSIGATYTDWDTDGTDALVRKIFDLVHTPSAHGKPVVVYFHCEAGCDRTGQVYAAYAMRFLGVSFEEANEENKKICHVWNGDRVPVQIVQHVNSYAFYCEYLEQMLGLPRGQCWPSRPDPDCSAIRVGGGQYDISPLQNSGRGYPVADGSTIYVVGVCEVLTPQACAINQCSRINASVCELISGVGGVMLGTYNAIRFEPLSSLPTAVGVASVPATGGVSGSSDGFVMSYRKMGDEGFVTVYVAFRCSVAERGPLYVSGSSTSGAVLFDWYTRHGCRV